MSAENATPTPRTDAIVNGRVDFYDSLERLLRDHARDLERELARLKADLEEARKERDAYRAVLEGAEYEHIDMMPSVGVDICRRAGQGAALITKLEIHKREVAERAAEQARQEAIEECRSACADKRRDAGRLAELARNDEVRAAMLNRSDGCDECERAIRALAQRTEQPAKKEGA